MAASDGSKLARRPRESRKTNACHLSILFVGREMNPGAAIPSNSPGSLTPITAYLSIRFTIMDRQRPPSFSVFGYGKVCLPPQPAPRSCGRCGVRGSAPRGPREKVGAASGQDIISLRTELRPWSTTPHRRPHASSSFALSRNLQASHGVYEAPAVCEAGSQKVWRKEAKAC